MTFSVPLSQVPTRVPPIPQRSPSLLDESSAGPSDVIYTDPKKINRAQLGLGTEMWGTHRPAAAGSLACSPSREPSRKLSDEDQNKPNSQGPAPSGMKPDQGSTMPYTPLGFSLPPSSEAPGSRATTWRQGFLKLSHETQSSSEASPSDAYQLVETSGLQEGKDRPDQRGSTYEQIPTCWHGSAKLSYPGVSPTYSQLAGPMDYGYEKISGTSKLPEPGNTYEQIPAAKNKDTGRMHKVSSLRGGW